MDKLNITLISINSKYVHSSLAVWYIKEGISTFSKHPHNTAVVEGTINQNPNEIINKIVEQKPDIAGFSCYIWNIDIVKKVASAVKQQLPNCTIVFGGPEVSFNAGDVLAQNEFVDFVISGEGELPFARLADSILNGTDEIIEGVCNRHHTCEPYISHTMPPSPYTKQYFDALGGRIAYFEASRGCPFNCAFCLSSRCTGVTYFDLDRVEHDLLALANSGAKTIKFVDRTFNANKKFAKAIVRFIIDNYNAKIPNGVCFHFEIAGDILDDELIELFTSAPIGAIQLEIGMQSFNEKTLAYVNRKTDCAVLIKNINRLVAGKNMHIHIDLIAGLTHEDFESFKNSFNTAFELGANMLQVGFLKLLHGAPMREQSEKFPCEYNSSPPYEVISTPYLSSAELDTIRSIEDAVDRTYNSERFRQTLSYVIGCGHSAFDVFLHITKSIKNSGGCSLFEYTELLFKALCQLKGVDTKKLRDVMVCDILSTTKGGKLPSVLKVEDTALKQAKNYFKLTQNTKNVMTATAILYSENCAVFVKYQNPHKITQKYAILKVPLKTIKDSYN